MATATFTPADALEEKIQEWFKPTASWVENQKWTQAMARKLGAYIISQAVFLENASCADFIAFLNAHEAHQKYEKWLGWLGDAPKS